MMGIIGIIVIVIMIMAITKSKTKLHAFLFICGWTVVVSAVMGLVAFLVAKSIHAGNPPGVAGDIVGPTVTFALLFTSLNRLRAATRVERAPTVPPPRS